MNKKLLDFLQELDLTDTEAQLYLGLLELGNTTVLELARHTGIKRATTHFNVESLIKKGLVAQTVKGTRRRIVAEDPKSLESVLEKKERSLNDIRFDLPNIIKTLQESSNDEKELQQMTIKYYQGKSEVMLIYEEVLKSKELRAYLNTKEILKVFPENVEAFIKTHNERDDFNIWEITENTEELMSEYINRMAPGRYFHKTIPSNLNLSIIDYMIFDGKVAIINPKEKIINGVIISDPYYYSNSKEIFDFLWNVLSTPELSSQ